MFFAAALVLVVSCAKEEVPAVQDKNDTGLTKITFTADLETPTKTSLVEGKKVYWTEGDRISVFGNVALANTSFSASEINNEKASFTGYVTEAATDAAYYAVYPYKESNKIEAKTDSETGAVTTILTTDIPYYQKAVKGGFDTDLNIMVAKTTPGEQHLSFKNVCSLIKFTIPESLTNVVSVGITSREILSGRVRIEFSEDGEYVMNSENNDTGTTNYKEVTLASESGTALESGDYYAVVRPNTYTYSLFHITVTMTDGTVQAFKMKENEEAKMAENNIYNLGTIDMSKMNSFKVTNAPVGDFPMGVATYQLTWEGGSPTFTNRTKDIATVDVNGLVTFTGKVGKAIVGVNCGGVDHRVAFNITKGYYRETFDVQSNASNWVAEKGGSSTYVKATESTEAYNLYTPASQTNGKYRVDAKRSGTTYLTRDFPVLCFRFDDVIDKNSSNTRNINIDSSGKTENGVEYKGNIGGNDNKWKTKYKCSDGSAILIYDLSSQAFPTGGELPVGEMLELSTFCIKYADIPLLESQTAGDISYRMFWFNTFKTMDEMNEYLQAWSTKTNITYN